MNRKTIPLAAVLLLLLLPSCFSTKKLPEAEPVKLREFTEADLVPAKLVAENFAGGFFKSLETKDFTHWKKQLPERDTQKIGEKEFQQFYNELYTAFGDFEKAEYLGEVISGNLRNFLWKMRFSKKENDKVTIREVVFFVRVYCEENKQPDISGFGVKLF